MITAALATIPGRPLKAVLESLRPQVDRLCVWCNGPSGILLGLAKLIDEVVIDPTNARRDCGKFGFVNGDSLYLTCDDDLQYPGDYVETMQRSVERWKGQCIVSVAGRRYKGQPAGFQDTVSTWRWNLTLSRHKWANYVITCATAFDARVVPVPSTLMHLDADAALTEWAQDHRVPVYLLPHPGHWLRYLLPPDAPTLWQGHKAENFRTRNAFIRGREWVQYVPPNYRAA